MYNTLCQHLSIVRASYPEIVTRVLYSYILLQSRFRTSEITIRLRCRYDKQTGYFFRRIDCCIARVSNPCTSVVFVRVGDSTYIRYCYDTTVNSKKISESFAVSQRYHNRIHSISIINNSVFQFHRVAILIQYGR